MSGVFNGDMISDAKRLVRGEHWLLARTLLRRRDRVHHRPWRILTLAGESPSEEIGCVRSLMPKAHVVCADRSETAIASAIDAGADDVFHGDIGAFKRGVRGGSGYRRLPGPISEMAPFDVINLDLCCSVDAARELVRAYSVASATSKGVFMATVSYGRDVAELFEPGEFGPVPEPLGGRVRALAEIATSRMRIASALAYPGNNMPMLSCVWEYERAHLVTDEPLFHRIELLPPKSFLRVNDADLFAAVSSYATDPAPLYGLPEDRIKNFRRRVAAMRAVATRRARECA